MESLAGMKTLFGGIYKGTKVLVTGHTGFKGSWLAGWLQMMGADVYGYSLEPPSVPNHISLLNPDIHSTKGDIRHLGNLIYYISEVQPEIVFHLAAQALVRTSYVNPVDTYTTNVIGTLSLLEACRKCDSVKAFVNVTSDKCYENREWIWGYRENDPMGGYDPYSASKGCSEIMTASYRNSFFNLTEYGKSHHILLASGRAGNVIGGGDWAADRLVPDMIRAASGNTPVQIRNPKATRPWQHVLEPLSGYLTLGWRLLEKKPEFAEAWNFGPAQESNLSVEEVFNHAKKYWDKLKVEYSRNPDDHHEANLLMLDCSKASKLLKWKSVWDRDKTIYRTIQWYKRFYENNDLLTADDIAEYVNDAKNMNIIWTK
jgi:CDP-glucose 4,6-dehydratase